MSHEETRLTILNTLYPIYFSEKLDRPLDTDSVLKEAFPEVTDFTRIYPELRYLDEHYLIKSVDALGHKHAIAIRITDGGIDEVESHNEELRNEHYTKRIKILEWLYQQFFDGKDTEIFSINDIAQATELGDSHAPEFLMELMYLYKKGLIEPLQQMGPIPISHAKITSYGIDTIESIVKQSIEEMEQEEDPQIRLSLDELNQENDSQSKITKALKLSQEIRQWLELFVRVAPTFIGQ